ncbi:MAG: hypothetical protein PHI32_12550, partial [Dysgonamonadaceae bacterium]|nr:hypothetical protein [Dysgonamonadaceae bacterium]
SGVPPFLSRWGRSPWHRVGGSGGKAFSECKMMNDKCKNSEIYNLNANCNNKTEQTQCINDFL